MKFHHPTKIVFVILAVMLIAAAVFIAVEYKNLKRPMPQPLPNLGLTTQPKGTCAPDLSDCKGNPELCMAENLNKVCN